MNTVTSPLAQALTLTRAMLAAAAGGQWERLAELEAERHPLAQRLHPQTAETRRLLGELLAYDRELIALVGQARDLAAGHWQRAADGVRAIAAYGADRGR